jgi:hypothetical protein
MNKDKIEIDLETYKLIESYRQSFNETLNDIIKRVLQSIIENEKIEMKKFSIINESTNSLNFKGLYWKGCLLPNGLKLKSSYKGVLHTAEVYNGKILFNNEEYNSPSAAAIAATNGISINGWLFWEFLDSNSNSWKSLNSLRKNIKNENRSI